MSVQTTNLSANPFTSPQHSSSVRPASSVKSLYSATQVAVATFVGGIAAGATLMAINQYRLRQKTAAMATMLIGVLILSAVLATSFALSSAGASGIGTFILLAQVFGARHVASKLFGDQYSATDFTSGSNWAVAGISILWSIIVLAAAVGGVIALGI